MRVSRHRSGRPAPPTPRAPPRTPVPVGSRSSRARPELPVRRWPRPPCRSALSPSRGRACPARAQRPGRPARRSQWQVGRRLLGRVPLKPRLPSPLPPLRARSRHGQPDAAPSRVDGHPSSRSPGESAMEGAADAESGACVPTVRGPPRGHLPDPLRGTPGSYRLRQTCRSAAS